MVSDYLYLRTALLLSIYVCLFISSPDTRSHICLLHTS